MREPSLQKFVNQFLYPQNSSPSQFGWHVWMASPIDARYDHTWHCPLLDTSYSILLTGVGGQLLQYLNLMGQFGLPLPGVVATEGFARSVCGTHACSCSQSSHVRGTGCLIVHISPSVWFQMCKQCGFSEMRKWFHSPFSNVYFLHLLHLTSWVCHWNRFQGLDLMNPAQMMPFLVLLVYS